MNDPGLSAARLRHMGEVLAGHVDRGDVPGRFGWSGGTGTSVYTDPSEGLIGVLLTQRHLTSPTPPSVLRDFWTCAYAAITG
ncbi:serine hydrolase [Actinomadura formosensis]|uniref:serine hydrolase n=1 Tax=Actinomadura formosensis TaxID=60706 RepID=UPI0008333DDA|nr:serine hydrolase [Actinomadura formosensis]